jgi:hypothetical protein
LCPENRFRSGAELLMLIKLKAAGRLFCCFS